MIEKNGVKDTDFDSDLTQEKSSVIDGDTETNIVRFYIVLKDKQMTKIGCCQSKVSFLIVLDLYHHIH